MERDGLDRNGAAEEEWEAKARLGQVRLGEARCV